MSRSTSGRFAPVACLLFAVLLAGCDSSEDRYKSALKKYETLMSARTPLTDVSYDALLKDLDAIDDGKASPQSKRLSDAIRSLRQPMKLPPRPLAVANAEGDDPVERKARECAELAKNVGLSADAGRDEAMSRLSVCRKELTRLDVARIHAQDPLGAHDEDAGR